MAAGTQPDEQRTRWGWIGVAVLAAVLGAAIAPPDWPTGTGSLRLSHGDVVIHESEITLGPGPQEAQGQTGASAGHDWHWRFPEGVPTDQPFHGTASCTLGGQPSGMADLRVELVLPGGDREALVVTGRSPGGDTWEVRRRPPVRARFVLALLFLVVVLWVTEAIPLWVTSICIPVVLTITQVAQAKAALAPFFHPIIALFFGGLLMAEAMKRVRLDQVIAVNIVARAARSPATLFMAVLATSAFLSMWMSNTASTALLIPIALAITEPLKNPGYRRTLILGLAYAATVGGIGSAIGTPANLLAIEFLGGYADRPITFIEWFAVGLPAVGALLPVVGFYLWFRMGVRVDPATFSEARRTAKQTLANAPRLDRKQLSVLGVFALVICGWLTQQSHGVHPGIVALGGAAILAMIGRVHSRDLGAISWASLLTFGGGLALGLVMVDSGTSDWIATRLAGLGALPPFLGTLLVASIALLLTAVASNTVSAAILIPLSIPLAGVLGLDAPTLVLTIAVASSIDFAMVIGTPPTMLAYATGLFPARLIFRVGIVLDLAGIVLLVTVVRWIWLLVGTVA